MDKRRVWNIAMIVIGTMAVIAVVGLVFTFVLPLSSGATKPKAYEVFSPRVKSLLASMSLREKIGQMTQMDVSTILANDGLSINATKLQEAVQVFGVGSYLNRYTPRSSMLLDAPVASITLHHLTSIMRLVHSPMAP